MEVRSLDVLTAEHVAALGDFDASFTTDVVLDVERLGGAGFRLTERPLSAPFSKRYRLDGHLRAGHAPPWGRLFVADDGVEIVGLAATTYESWSKRQRLDELHVLPSARGRGVARRLVDAVREEAARQDARELWLETQNVNVPAVRAYQRLGFAISGIDLNRYPDPYLDEVGIFLSSPTTRRTRPD